MAAILSFILTPIGRLLAGAGGVVALVSWFAWDQRSRGAEKERAAIEKRADTNAKLAEKERDSVRDLPADRLRDRWSRD